MENGYVTYKYGPRRHKLLSSNFRQAIGASHYSYFISPLPSVLHLTWKSNLSAIIGDIAIVLMLFRGG